MKNKVLQILYDLRHQPVISGVTLIGTALTIFLIMVVVMIQQIPVLPFAPESNRPRLLIGCYIHLENLNEDGIRCAGISFNAAKKLYENLEGVSDISYFQQYTEKEDVKGPTGKLFIVNGRKADADFFKIFNHTLVKGRFYTREEADAMENVAVVAETTAYRLFGDSDPLGETFQYGFKPYRVIGVIKDNSTLATFGSGDVFIPTSQNDGDMSWEEYRGNASVALLAEPGVDFGSIRAQVKARYAALSTELEESGWEAIYHEQPYDIETVSFALTSGNGTPDMESIKKSRYIIFIILLLVPAINLSSMLHSRMRRRISEIGVRRAFGCTRARIILDIISENFIITLAGGIVGLLLGIIVGVNYVGIYDTMQNIGNGGAPALSLMFNWSILLTALVVCFLLNIISAAVPAWQASRENVVDAINTNK